jgi:hypothetical protein
LAAGGLDRINVQNNPVNFIDPYGKEPVTVAVVTTYAAYTAATAIAAGIVYYGAPIAADIGEWLGNKLWNENTEDKTERHKDQIKGDLDDLIEKETEIRNDPTWGPDQKRPKRTQQRIKDKMWEDAWDYLDNKDNECP